MVKNHPRFLIPKTYWQRGRPEVSGGDFENQTRKRRVGREVECGGLENRCGATHRGFESLTLRIKKEIGIFQSLFYFKSATTSAKIMAVAPQILYLPI